MSPDGLPLATFPTAICSVVGNLPDEHNQLIGDFILNTIAKMDITYLSIDHHFVESSDRKDSFHRVIRELKHAAFDAQLTS
jgi:hypothetical protein